MTRHLAPVAHAPAVSARDLDVVTSGASLLREVSLEVPVGEHLAVLGPNGAGKTTLLQLLATYRFPTRGRLALFGHQLGRVDVRALRPSIGLVSVALDPLVDDITVLRLVAGSCVGAILPPPSLLDDAATVDAATAALARVGASHLGERRVLTLSQGERQRVRIARALASGPELLLLDEPFAGLDVGGRERLLGDLDRLLTEPDGPTIVLVSHHLEELPTRLRRAVLLADGTTAVSGPIDDVLTSAHLSAVFGLALRVERTDDGRWRAVGARADST